MVMAERIKEMRKKNKLNQEELAESIDVSPMTLRRWEWGQRSPRAEELQKLSEVLGVPVSYLMGLDTDAAPVVIEHDTPVQIKAVAPQTQTKTENRGILSYTFKNGEKLELPATPEYVPQFWAFVNRATALQPAASPA